jgi:hypothetical protein
MESEFTRLAILYAHLLACCVAIGTIVTSDIAMVRQLLSPALNPEREAASHLRVLQLTVSRALWLLWITGAAIIAVDVADKGLDYLGNPKLQAKLAIVLLLTLNGMVLHRYVLPAMAQGGSLLQLPVAQRRLAILAGTISGVSWLYAAMLGIGRPLAWKYSLPQLMSAYPLLIAGGVVAMSLLVAWAIFHRDTDTNPLQSSDLVGVGF